MSMRMLIDAAHPEETRVAVIRGSQIEEFDLESANRKQLKGNIYLAKVTRVEPSLQAAFVDFGGNRHGFLAFSEIHPDYYRIPTEDKKALLKQEADEAARLTAESEKKALAADKDGGDADDAEEGSQIESLGDDELGDAIRAGRRTGRRYKIQEVVSKRQVLLIQVVKEERGTKGAALTTYLSLAGRYCVLMPNSPRGGGVSRKISGITDRKKLKKVLADFDLPDGMGAIIRTAGMKRTKAEIKRDFTSLMRQWEGICERTLDSVAPVLIHEEGSLVTRAIRDLYVREVDEILVEGEEGYRTAKDYMRLLVPSHAKRVKHYRDKIPLFHRYQVEAELDTMYSPTIQLKSGGYIVINTTEALVAIDVNSGRATRESSIERTALRTNVEAAEEVARQLRLRDLAGLIVIDFIDMEENRNNRQVERKFKDSLRSDRARLQVGRISHFGLLEMSRQRLRPGLLEASTKVCPSCNGAGILRSTQSAALHVLRVLEEEGVRHRSAIVTVRAASAVAAYLLNEKRDALTEIEARYEFSVRIYGDQNLSADQLEIDRAGIGPERTAEADGAADAGDRSAAATGEAQKGAKRVDGEGEGRRRRRGRRPSSARKTATETKPAVTTGDGAEATAAEAAPDESGDQDRPPRPKRRRGRRGGRRRRPAAERAAESAPPTEEAPEAIAGNGDDVEPTPPTPAEKTVDAEAGDTEVNAEAGDTAVDAKPPKAAKKKPRRRAAKKTKPSGDSKAKARSGDDGAESEPDSEATGADKATPDIKPDIKPDVTPDVAPDEAPSPAPAEPVREGPRRRGWWQGRAR